MSSTWEPMAKGKQTPLDAGGTEAIWAGSPMEASMISLRDMEVIEARGYEGKELFMTIGGPHT